MPKNNRILLIYLSGIQYFHFSFSQNLQTFSSILVMCSSMIRIVHIQAWFSYSLSSIGFFIISSKILVIILQVLQSRVISLQLSQNGRFPLFLAVCYCIVSYEIQWLQLMIFIYIYCCKQDCVIFLWTVFILYEGPKISDSSYQEYTRVVILAELLLKKVVYNSYSLFVVSLNS